MSIPAAIAVAGIIIGVGLAVGIGFGCYFFYRLFCVLAAAMTGNPAIMRRAMIGQTKAPKQPEGEKVVAEMPDLGIETMQGNEETMQKLREKQDSSGNY